MRIGLALLRAHVLQRADELTDIGLHGRDHHVRVGRAGHAEIDDLRLPEGVDEDVGRFQVTVNDALLVPVVNGVADAYEQPQPLAGAEVLGRDEVGDGLGVGDVFHGEIRNAAFTLIVRARFVDLGDVGMPQAPEDLRLKLEPPQGGGGRDPVLHHLERDGAARMVLHRHVDRAHGPGGDHVLDGVAADSLRRRIGGRPGDLVRRRHVQRFSVEVSVEVGAGVGVGFGVDGHAWESITSTDRRAL